MALWKDPSVKEPSTGMADQASPSVEPVVRAVERPAPSQGPVAVEPARRPADRGSAKESLIAADVTIEGKIEGAGHVRIAGRFKGDVNVQGNVTIEQGAHVTGQVNAATVVVSGEVQGNIDATSRVELLRDRRHQRRRQGGGGHGRPGLAHARPGRFRCERARPGRQVTSSDLRPA